MSGTRIAPSREEQRTAWKRLGRALRPRANRSQVIVAALCLLLGVSIAVQVRQHDEDALSGADQQELVRLLDESNRHVSELEAENRDLDSTLKTLKAAQSDEAAAQDAASKRMDELQIIAGVIPAHGRGIRITITEDSGQVRASTLLGVVQELRNAGAEVIQIGDVRVVTSTAVTAGDGGVLQVDGRDVRPPFSIRVIGDPTVMEPALRIPGGAADTVRSDGGRMSISAEDDVIVDAVVELTPPEHAEVVK